MNISLLNNTSHTFFDICKQVLILLIHSTWRMFFNGMKTILIIFSFFLASQVLRYTCCQIKHPYDLLKFSENFVLVSNKKNAPVR